MMDSRRELVERGVSFLPGLVTPETLADLDGALARNRAAGRPRSRQVLYTHGPVPPGRPPLTALMDQWLSPHRVAGAGSTRAVAEVLRPVARRLLGEQPVLFQDLLLVKRKGQAEFPWHQDFGFWPVDRPLALVFWLPFQASDSATAALRFAVGSHTLGPRPVVDLHSGEPQSAGAELGFNPDDWPIYAPTYTAGDAVVFNPLTFHASPAMTRPGERKAWSCIFLSPRVRWCHANAPNHPLCRVVPNGEPVVEAPYA